MVAGEGGGAGGGEEDEGKQRIPGPGSMLVEGVSHALLLSTALGFCFTRTLMCVDAYSCLS